MSAVLEPRGGVSRRQFMVGAAGLTFGVEASTLSHAALYDTAAATKASVALSPWVSIAADGTISLMSPAVEMGQGTLTSLPLIIAEELDADWAKVRIVAAPPDDKLYANPAFGMMYTAGSNAVRAYYSPLRIFGAQVRRVLMLNAAERWQVALSELTTEPSVVVHAKTGRRLAYGEIAQFAKLPAQAPEIKAEGLKHSSQFRLIGHDVMRAELPTKVNGSARYSVDVHVPGMVYAAVLRSPVEGGAPVKVDDKDARAVPGVLKVVVLPYGVAVIADRPFPAFKAKGALKVTWSSDAKGWSFSSPAGHEAFKSAVRDTSKPGGVWTKAGDAPAELARAKTVIEAEYQTDFAYHAQMEPLNSVASVSPRGDTVEVWCGTQGQTMAVAAVASAAGVPEDRVTFHGMLLGGGFGRRGHRDEEFIVDSVLLSKEIKRPVKVIWQRQDDVHNGRFRPLTAHLLRAGLDERGAIVAWHHRTATDNVTAYQDPVRFKKAGNRDFIAMRGSELTPYTVPNQLIEQVGQESGVRTSALRAIGFGPNKFAAESFLDEIAAKRGMDPIVFRLELLANVPRARAVVERVAAMSDWKSRGKGRGLGFSFVDYDGSQVAMVAEVSVDKKTGQISVHNVWTVIDPGVAVQPDNVKAQTEGSIVYGIGLALMERITVAKGIVEQSNFHDYPVPRMKDVPQMHVDVMSTAHPPTGAGQMATPLVAPAIANAVATLTGVRLRQMPMLPERVLAALKTGGVKA